MIALVIAIILIVLLHYQSQIDIPLQEQTNQIILIFTITETVSIWVLIYVEIYPRLYAPKLTLNLRVWKAHLPEFGIASHRKNSEIVESTVLIAEVQNNVESKENARNCRAKLKIDDVTLGNEYIPWRFLEVASGRGSSWHQYHNIGILKGDTGILFVCWTEKGEKEGYLQTSSPQVQWNPYMLPLDKEYRATLTIIGDFKPCIWTFTFKMLSWDRIEFTKPEKIH